jgi:hypothetical protein
MSRVTAPSEFQEHQYRTAESLKAYLHALSGHPLIAVPDFDAWVEGSGEVVHIRRGTRLTFDQYEPTPHPAPDDLTHASVWREGRKRAGFVLDSIYAPSEP